jgi:hypothetical protein
MTNDQHAQISEIVRQARLRIDAISHPKVAELLASHPDASLSINTWSTPPIVSFITNINANGFDIDLIDFNVSCSDSEVWLNQTIELYKDHEIQINLDCGATQSLPAEHRDLLRRIGKIQTIETNYETLICN